MRGLVLGELAGGMVAGGYHCERSCATALCCGRLRLSLHGHLANIRRDFTWCLSNVANDATLATSTTWKFDLRLRLQRLVEFDLRRRQFRGWDDCLLRTGCEGIHPRNASSLEGCKGAADFADFRFHPAQDERPGKYLATHIDTNWATRDEESYLVAVESGNTKGTIWLYWPRVSWLRKVEG